jgi:hypothetical protein
VAGDGEARRRPDTVATDITHAVRGVAMSIRPFEVGVVDGIAARRPRRISGQNIG